MTILRKDIRDLRAGDLILLVGRVHYIHRVRAVNLALPHWAPQTDVDGNALGIPATEILHEAPEEPGLICTTIPHGAQVNFVLPV